MNTPAFAVKFVDRATRWGIKHGPTVLKVVSNALVVGGAVRLFKDSIKIDGILDHHKEQMAYIEAHIVSGELSDPVEVRKMKTAALLNTTKDLGLAVAPSAIMIGLGLMGLNTYGGIMKGRHEKAVMLLTAIDKSFAAYRNRVEEELGVEKAQELLHPKTTKMLKPGVDKLPDDAVTTEKIEPTEDDYVRVLEPGDEAESPFTFWFDKNHPQWSHGFSKGAMNLNRSRIKAKIMQANFLLSNRHKTQLFIDDILMNRDLLGFDDDRVQNEYTHAYGYSVRDEVADPIVVEQIPYIYWYEDDDNHQFPMRIQTTWDDLEDIFLKLENGDMDYSEFDGYGIMLQFMRVGRDGRLENPRCIYNELYN